MKVEIWYDQRYPDYGITNEQEYFSGCGRIVDISPEEYAEYERIRDLYEEMQAKLVLWVGRQAAEQKEESETA
jgi:hypothetical protein